MTSPLRSPFTGILQALIRQRGVLGSMVVSESDGIIVDSNLQIGVRGPVVAALAASLVLLVESFGRDVAWLWQHRPVPVVRHRAVAPAPVGLLGQRQPTGAVSR